MVAGGCGQRKTYVPTLLWVSFPCMVSTIFKFILGLVGDYMCSDEETDNHMKSDIVIFFIKTKYSMNLNETFNVDVNNKIYRVKLVEDMHGPKRIFIPKVDSIVNETEDSGSDGEMKRGIIQKMKKMVILGRTNLK